MIHRILRLLRGHAFFEDFFNTPIKFRSRDEYVINERLIEMPFVMSCIPQVTTRKILDFGCTRNWLALSLASMGHSVWGVDLRDYPFKHPNLVFQKKSILDIELEYFDYIVALSTLEHVGLGVYGDAPENELLNKVVEKLHELLSTNGELILTLPVGHPSIDEFERSFTPDEVDQLFSGNGFVKHRESFFKRISQQNWNICSEEEIREVSNSRGSREIFGSGVNGIGCYVFSKSLESSKLEPSMVNDG